MNTLEAIAARRSIRRYKPDPVPEELVRKVLEAGTLAPSGHNRQPWEFVVLTGDSRDEMVAVMREGIEIARGRGASVAGPENTAAIMAQAPVTIFCFDPFGGGTGSINDLGPEGIADLGTGTRHLIDVQSAGACIQNMCLAAAELGLGSLWIGHTLIAYDNLCEWLGRKDLMVTALALGWPDESPGPRPRKSVDEITTWM